MNGLNIGVINVNLKGCISICMMKVYVMIVGKKTLGEKIRMECKNCPDEIDAQNSGYYHINFNLPFKNLILDL